MEQIGNCNLCLQEKPLCDSHIIPAFVYRWLKKTSPTGYIRKAVNINKRVEDGDKLKLFCPDCEAIFNKFETEFSRNIFYPYVEKELSQECVAQGLIKQFDYDEWLLNFVISVQWRVILKQKNKDKIPERLQKRLDEFKEDARTFLLGKNNYIAENESHIIFLQNIAFGEGDMLSEFPDGINNYILRDIDSTPISSKVTIGIYTKIGPIVLYTAIHPKKLSDSIDSKIRKRGSIKTAQKLGNHRLNKYIFINRVKEIMLIKQPLSERQRSKIKGDMEKDPDRLLNSPTMHAALGDEYLRSLKK
jgi:hypothetical protein